MQARKKNLWRFFFKLGLPSAAHGSKLFFHHSSDKRKFFPSPEKLVTIKNRRFGVQENKTE